MRSIIDEYDYLIHLVRCAIHEKTPSECPNGVSFDSVYDAAKSHDIANIAFYSVEKLSAKPEEELFVKWRAKRDSAIVRDMNQSYAADELRLAFGEAGIRSVEVQGTRLKAFYPRHEYRTMSDIDFIIDKGDLDRASEILEGLGYRCKNERGIEVDGFRRPNIYVEIHTTFFSELSEYCGILGDPFDSVKNDTDGVSREIFYLYNVLHAAKHYFGDGCGIRRVLDMYYLSRSFADVAESDYVKETLRLAGITGFAADMAELADCLFGETETEVPERLCEMLATVKSAGVHGNIDRRLKNRLEKDKKSGAKHVKFRYAMRRIFPEKWVLHQNYPVLRRHPWLTPFCVVHRSVKVAVKKPGKVVREIKAIKDTDVK